MEIKKNTPLIVTDQLDALKNFYCEHFGFKPVFASDEFLCLQSNEAACEISFMMPTCPDTQPHQGMAVTFCFEVADVDAEHKRLAGRGVQIAQPPKDNPWGDRSTIAVDPIGIGVYIYQPIPPTEEYAKYIVE
ncbi:MAG: VOC family protein [Myxococcota bacterium]|nr:VOC family protein [Myxococcota bacterium]